MCKSYVACFHAIKNMASVSATTLTTSARCLRFRHSFLISRTAGTCTKRCLCSFRVRESYDRRFRNFSAPLLQDEEDLSYSYEDDAHDAGFMCKAREKIVAYFGHADLVWGFQCNDYFLIRIVDIFVRSDSEGEEQEQEEDEEEDEDEMIEKTDRLRSRISRVEDMMSECSERGAACVCAEKEMLKRLSLLEEVYDYLLQNLK